MAENQRQGPERSGQGGPHGHNDDVFRNDREANRQGEMTRNREDEKRDQSDEQSGRSGQDGTQGKNR